VRIEELDYDLPPELVATRPVEPRDACRLMVVSRSDPALMEHRVFRDLPEYLRPQDLLVFNRSAVLPARLAGQRVDTGGRVEGLYVGTARAGVWSVLLKTKGRLAPGVQIALCRSVSAPARFVLELVERAGEGWLAAVVDRQPGDRPLTDAQVLGLVGATPLPPYILKARRDRDDQIDDVRDREWYQTVYAAEEASGSVAAPTAGLHFTQGLLDRLGGLGVGRAEVVLHVGIGTFKPIASEVVEEHPMHEEQLAVPGATVAAIGARRAIGGRVIAIGTTTVRALESLPDPLTLAVESEGFHGPTRLFIRPGHRFRFADGLVTNFHLPRSTLLAMVGAMFEGGVPRLLEIYREGVARGYRFYSYGDAMLVLP